MDSSWGSPRSRFASGQFRLAKEVRQPRTLLSPLEAWRLLLRRTGARLSRTTFYRWLESGKVYSVRMGNRIYIPWQALEEVIKKCLQGETL